MRHIGICRFSYPAFGGFKRMHETIAEREAYLFDDTRMDLRFRHFEALTLPSIAAQTDPDFTFLIVIGENMPAPWLERLRDICAPVPQVKIRAMRPMRHRRAMQKAIQAELGANETDSIQWRLDDDDAVGLDFVERTRAIVRDTATLCTDWKNLAMEFSRGFSVALSQDGIIAEDVKTPFWACGLAVLFRPGDPATVMNYGHHKLHHDMPMLIQPDIPMYIRAVHGDNDSSARIKPGLLEPLSDDRRALFKARFNVDEAQVRRVFASPSAPRGRV